MKKLNPGDQAPNFTLKDQNENPVSLSDFKGEKLLLYFYPKADTPGCTVQSCNVRDARGELAAIGIETIGVSPDKPSKQAKFDSKHGLGFPLLADEDHQTAEAYGAWGEKSMYGKKYMGIIRSAFLIDEDGKIAVAIYGVSPKDTVPKIMSSLGA